MKRHAMATPTAIARKKSTADGVLPTNVEPIAFGSEVSDVDDNVLVGNNSDVPVTVPLKGPPDGSGGPVGAGCPVADMVDNSD